MAAGQVVETDLGKQGPTAAVVGRHCKLLSVKTYKILHIPCRHKVGQRQDSPDSERGEVRHVGFSI